MSAACMKFTKMTANPNIKKLFEICGKRERRIIGLMSGTSLDGLDVALCSFSGSGTETEMKLLNFHTIEYSDEEKAEIRKVFGKSEIDFQQLCMLNPWIGNLHGEMILQCLKMWGLENQDIDVIASHGQTVFHAPKSFHKVENYNNSTLQIGDGDHIAVKTGIITISDFRQKNIAAGGEGAPLAIYGDFLLFSKAGEDRILLNMGGIANFTYLPGSSSSKSLIDMLSTDTGPGNTLLDAFAREMFGKAYDKDGNFAKSGAVNDYLLQGLKAHGFFNQKCPKTTGPELFSTEYVKTALKNTNTEDISPFDLMATLTRFTVETIAETIKKTVFCKDQDRSEEKNLEENAAVKIYISGGGSNNTFLVNQLRGILFECTIHPMDDLGVSGDAKEAVLFATLANECLFGSGKYNNNNSTTTTTAKSTDKKSLLDITMGKISFPL